MQKSGGRSEAAIMEKGAEPKRKAEDPVEPLNTSKTAKRVSPSTTSVDREKEIPVERKPTYRVQMAPPRAPYHHHPLSYRMGPPMPPYPHAPPQRHTIPPFPYQRVPPPYMQRRYWVPVPPPYASDPWRPRPYRAALNLATPRGPQLPRHSVTPSPDAPVLVKKREAPRYDPDMVRKGRVPPTGRKPFLLAHPDDHLTLTPYQCLLRKHIEIFEADANDCKAPFLGRNKPLVLGQVGVRCKHCAHLCIRRRTRGSVYYPHQLIGIYQSVQSLAGGHFLGRRNGEICPYLPKEDRENMERMREGRPAFRGNGKAHWAELLEGNVGVYENDEEGLKLKPLAPPEQSPKQVDAGVEATVAPTKEQNSSLELLSHVCGGHSQIMGTENEPNGASHVTPSCKN